MDLFAGILRAFSLFALNTLAFDGDPHTSLIIIGPKSIRDLRNIDSVYDVEDIDTQLRIGARRIS
jgi:hypothetical protein